MGTSRPVILFDRLGCFCVGLIKKNNYRVFIGVSCLFRFAGFYAVVC